MTNIERAYLRGFIKAANQMPMSIPPIGAANPPTQPMQQNAPQPQAQGQPAQPAQQQPLFNQILAQIKQQNSAMPNNPMSMAMNTKPIMPAMGRQIS